MFKRLLNTPTTETQFLRFIRWLLVAVSLAIVTLVVVMALKGFSLGVVLLACAPLVFVKLFLYLGLRCWGGDEDDTSDMSKGRTL